MIPPSARFKVLVFPTHILVGGLKHFLCSIIYGIMLPIDELIFFKMVIAPPSHIVWIQLDFASTFAGAKI